MNWRTVLTPNESSTRQLLLAVTAGWLIAWLGIWIVFRPAIFPSPLEVIAAWPVLLREDGLGDAIVASLWTNVEALALSTAIGLPLAYLSRVLLFRPLALGISKLRFLSPAVFFLLLLFAVSSGHMVKVWMLTLGETFFLVTSMLAIVWNVPPVALDDARTLRMSEWAVLWYSVVRGTLDQAMQAIRDNAAMGFAMLTMVEGIIRSEGGLGVLLLNQEKHMSFPAVYAIVATVLALGLIQDFALGVMRETLCPHVVES
jgi:NitT/TauT family transport system permease protein